jgi:ribosome-binding factor A
MTSTNDAASVTKAKLAFEHAAPFFRARLCDALPIKRTPELSFRFDPAVLSVKEPE